MSLHHGWGCHPIQTASCIHIRHIQGVWAHWYAVHRHMVEALRQLWSQTDVIMSWLRLILFKLLLASLLYFAIFWAHWYAVHRHMVAALLSYTHPNWLQFWWSGSLVELKWCHYVMFEAATLFKLLPASILDIYNTKCLSTLICCPYAYGSSLTQLLPPHLAQILVIRFTCRVEMTALHHDWGCHPIQTASCIHIRHIQSVLAHWYAVHMHNMVAVFLSCTHPTWLRFWVLGQLWSWKNVITSWLRLPSYSNCFPHPY